MTQKSEWVKMKPEEAKKIIIDLAHKGTPVEQIGLVLRDQHGIPKAKLLGLKINQVLKEAKIHINPSHIAVKNKIENVEKHILKNKKDTVARRSLIKHNSRIKKLA